MVLDHEDSPGMVGVKRRQQTPRKSPRKSPRRSASLRGNENVNGNATRIEAQNRVLAELRNLKAALVEAGDSVSYLNAETKELDGKMRGLEKAAGKVYTPFRAALFEFAADQKCHSAGNDSRDL